MPERTYWLDLFTGKTWREFLAAGGTVSGFRESRWATLQKVKPGDYLQCYLTGISRWIGILEVTSKPFKDATTIWEEEAFPCRVRVKILAQLTPETAVPILDMRGQLSIFKELETKPVGWTGYLRGSPSKWSASDGEAVCRAVFAATSNPVVRPIDAAKLEKRPKPLKAKIGLVTVPESEGSEEPKESASEPSAHAEIQWLLLKLGSDMGFDIWVARNDRGREVRGNKFLALPNLKTSLPLQFDEATNKTIELIDVLWLSGNAIIAAFEIESTTSIYSGLLRMGDLVAMQPNLNIPLYLVAPDDRREKVFGEVNRPTFSRLSPPLSEMCRFIPFSTLREKINQVGSFIRYLKPDFLVEISESCEVD